MAEPPWNCMLPTLSPSGLRTAQAAVRDADSLLLAVLRNPTKLVLHVSSTAGQHWWVDLATARVTGSPLSVAIESTEAASLRFSVLAQGPGPADAGRAMALDQWVYWLARHTRGDLLYGYSDLHRLSVQRGAASPTHGRDFARLMVALQQPLTVAEAALHTRCEPAMVRRFLNASTVLERVRVHSGSPLSLAAGEAQPAVPPASLPRMAADSADAETARQPGLFSRLLNRLRGRP